MRCFTLSGVFWHTLSHCFYLEIFVINLEVFLNHGSAESEMYIAWHIWLSVFHLWPSLTVISIYSFNTYPWPEFSLVLGIQGVQYSLGNIDKLV